jgi:large subunit ribosomal protein L1
MTKRSKKYENARKTLGARKMYAPQEGLAKVKSLAYARFDESVDVHVNLGIDPEKGDQVLRGSVLLPHGTGRKIRVLVFAKGDQATAAEKAGADYVGSEDLIKRIEEGWFDFDFAVTTPDLMTMVSKVARILGPRGLLPNKKTGTVTDDVAETVVDLKKGRLFFKNDKSGLVHFTIGRVSFAPEALLDNLQVFMRALTLAKPAAARGVFIKKVTVASTMGVGIALNPHDL